jgi:hypothetical protein
MLIFPGDADIKGPRTVRVVPAERAYAVQKILYAVCSGSEQQVLAPVSRSTNM